MFLLKENVGTLWEIIQEEEIPNMNKQLFIHHVQMFGDRERENIHKQTLFQMNTKFITVFLQLFKTKKYREERDKKLAPHLVNDIGPIKLKIQDNLANYSITAEELHTERMDNFSKEFSQKQNEFNSMMTQNKPNAPNFSDNSVQDEPKIGAEMEQLIARTLAQRNFDIEQIQGPTQSIQENKKHISWSATDNIDYFVEELGDSLESGSVANEVADKVANEVTKELNQLTKTDSIFSKLKTINPNEDIKKEIKVSIRVLKQKNN